MSTHLPDDLIDLLVAEATEGLAPADLDRIDERLQGQPEELRESFEHAAAVTHLAMLEVTPEARGGMPSEARARLLGALQTADQPLAPPAPVESAEAPAPARTEGGFGWAAAAAVTLAWGLSSAVQQDFLGLRAALFGEPAAPAIAQLPSDAERRRALLAEDPSAVTVAWNQSTPEFAGVTGDVVWSDARQEGFMRLIGMPVNDPQQRQYQLWIVDPERDANPVDGGVFNIASSATGEVIVPIDAKLSIDAPTVFAITEEQPGGVVVSDGPLVLIAAL